jgi:hypothetical protein
MINQRAHKRGIGAGLADVRIWRCMESPSVVSQLFIPPHSGVAGFFEAQQSLGAHFRNGRIVDWAGVVSYRAGPHRLRQGPVFP